MSKDKFDYHKIEHHKKIMLVGQVLGLAGAIIRIASVKWDRDSRKHVPVYLVALLIGWPIRLIVTAFIEGAVFGVLLFLRWLLEDRWKRKFGSK